MFGDAAVGEGLEVGVRIMLTWIGGPSMVISHLSGCSCVNRDLYI